MIIGQFFAALARTGGRAAPDADPLSRLLTKIATSVRGTADEARRIRLSCAPNIVDEALDVLASEGSDARVLAGGQSLMPMLNMRLAKPKPLIDIMRLTDLDRIERNGGTVTHRRGRAPGRLCSHGRNFADSLPLVALALPWIGHVQTRSRGTVCGSIAHADPSAELPLVLRALGGEVHLRSAQAAPARGGGGLLRRHDGDARGTMTN